MHARTTYWILRWGVGTIVTAFLILGGLLLHQWELLFVVALIWVLLWGFIASAYYGGNAEEREATLNLLDPEEGDSSQMGGERP